QEVTPPGAPASGEFNFVEPSHTNPAVAYAAMDNRNVGDYLPHIFRTRDYGAHWQQIIAGLPTGEPEGSFVRVVREDPETPGLLYCGTENTVYVSFDDGDRWQSLRLNLPTTSIRDLVVHGVARHFLPGSLPLVARGAGFDSRQATPAGPQDVSELPPSDLVIGTYGRGVYILDDMSPLRQLVGGGAARIESAQAYFFAPGEAVRVHNNLNADTPFPPEVPHNANPPAGAILYYYLAQPPRGPIVLEVHDAQGQLVRTLSSQPAPGLAAFAQAPQTVPDYWKRPVEPLPTAAGGNRAVWDLRYALPPGQRLSLPMTAIYRDTPPAPQGPLALPGAYTLTLRVDGKAYTRSLRVVNDPREGDNAAELAALHALQMKILAALEAGRALDGLIAQARQSGAASASALDKLAGGGGRGRGAASAAPTL
ncbi:MAG: WD40/YVTN/BNR-like repeat-containing protein, partial [Streptosporangiaceae bacterium]